MSARKTKRNAKPAKAPAPAIDRAAAPVDFGAGIWPSRVAALAPLVIALAALAAYSNTFHVPFLFDDDSSIRDNPTIRQLWPLSVPLSPPGGGVTVAGRPLLNLSFALNYALGGLNLRGYHAFNLMIHILAGLTLFGLARRTLRRPVLSELFSASADWLACCIALLWTLHPLQTEGVTYIAQRAESMVSLFYLLTLYSFARGLETEGGSRPWFALSATACLLGSLTKEVSVTAPVLVLLYDRTFGAGSFREAWRRRRWYYAALCATWLPLGVLIARAGGRGGTAGLWTGTASWEYAKIQSWALLRYMELAFWPRTLVFDYGAGGSVPFAAIAGRAFLVLALLVAAVFALWRKPILGFAMAAFFVILSPSSSFVPVATVSAAEYRMYLALAPLLALAAAGVYRAAKGPGLIFLAAWAIFLGFRTHDRNRDYETSLSLWADTLEKRPNDPRVQNNYGLELLKLGRRDEAKPYFEKALATVPEFADAHLNLAKVLIGLEKVEEARTEFERARALDPYSHFAEYALGRIDAENGNRAAARAHYEAALRIKPDYAEAKTGILALGRNDPAPAGSR